MCTFNSVSIDEPWPVPQIHVFAPRESLWNKVHSWRVELYIMSPLTTHEGAPPCEVYNFSVTATYVGVTYTGAGCSVPGPVISTMLPSLPNLERLEFSLMYSLVHESE